MDYETAEGLSRKQIRCLAGIVKRSFGIKGNIFPTFELLRKFEDKYEDNLYTEIVEDNSMDINVPCCLDMIDPEHFVIKIKESVYLGATKNVAKDLSFITHELSHFILIYIFGFYPSVSVQRNLCDKIPPFKSAEWQAKTMTCELVIDYERFRYSRFDEIKEQTHATDAQIYYFLEKVAG